MTNNLYTYIKNLDIVQHNGNTMENVKEEEGDHLKIFNIVHLQNSRVPVEGQCLTISLICYIAFGY